MPAVSFRIRRGPHYKASRILALAKTKPDAAIEPPLRDKRQGISGRKSFMVLKMGPQGASFAASLEARKGLAYLRPALYQPEQYDLNEILRLGI